MHRHGRLEEFELGANDSISFDAQCRTNCGRSETKSLKPSGWSHNHYGDKRFALSPNL